MNTEVAYEFLEYLRDMSTDESHEMTEEQNKNILEYTINNRKRLLAKGETIVLKSGAKIDFEEREFEGTGTYICAIHDGNIISSIKIKNSDNSVFIQN